MSEVVLTTGTGTQEQVEQAITAVNQNRQEPPPKPGTPPPETPEAKPEEKAATPPEAKPEPKPEPRVYTQDTIDEMQNRIGKLTHQRYRTEEQLQAASNEIAALRTQIAALSSTPATPAAGETFTEPEPQEIEIGSKYADWGAFTKATSEWAARKEAHAIRQEIKRGQVESERSRATEAEQQAAAAALTSFQGRAIEFAKGHEDYNATVAVLGSAEHPIPAVAQGYILESEMGPELAYHLATHPEDLKQINAAPKPGMVIARLGRLEERLERAKTPAKTPDPPPISKTPIPPEPPSNTTVTSDVVPKTDGSNFAQWREQRLAEQAQRRRRW